MPICKLCNEREADKSGSHLITDYILRSMLVDGDTRRRSDRIISNRIDTFGTDLFLGRDINQDKVNELLGRDISDEELARNINHYTVDKIFCSACEDRFSHLESIFKTDVYDEIQSIDTTDKSVGLSEDKTFVFKLFRLSIFWRCSVVKFDTFSLDSKSERRIGSILNESLGNSVNDTKELIKKNSSKINSEVLGVLYVQNTDDYLSNIVFCNPFLNMPYQLVINDFYLFYYSKQGHVNAIKQSMYKLDNLFKIDDYVNLNNCVTIKIGIIPEKNFKDSRSYIYGLKTSSFLKNNIELFKDAYSLVLGESPSSEAIGSFVDDLVNKDDINVFERYKTDRILLKIKENIIKYVG